MENPDQDQQRAEAPGQAQGLGSGLPDVLSQWAPEESAYFPWH
jgi:hypothetical protein